MCVNGCRQILLLMLSYLICLYLLNIRSKIRQQSPKYIKKAVDNTTFKLQIFNRTIWDNFFHSLFMLSKYTKGFIQRDRYLTFKICILMHKRCILMDIYSMNLPLFISGFRFLNIVEGARGLKIF